MSIAAISQSFISAVRAAPSTEPVQAVAKPERATGRQEGRRHDLVDALGTALGLETEPTKTQSQALFRFAQRLMQDLRSLDGGGEGEQGGRALGRRDWGDLPQRLVALATAAGKPAESNVAAPAAAPAAPPTAAARVEEPIPDTPNPVTTATMAVHIMRVPSSHLIEAYAAMQRALGLSEPATPADTRSGLAALAGKLAAALQTDAKAALPAGSVLHVTA